MITRTEILQGHEPPVEFEENLQDLFKKINILRGIWGKPMIVTSGYRPPQRNAMAGGAPNSAHLYCQAVDIRDNSRKFAEWCLQNQAILEEIGLWMEDPSYTKGWVHLQTRPANNRVFKP